MGRSSTGNNVKSSPELSALVGRLAAIRDTGARLAFLRKNRALYSRAAVEFIYEEVVRLARVDLRQADHLAQSAAWIAERIGDDFCRAQGWRAAGHVRLIGGRYGEALQSYQSALSIFRRLKLEAEIGRTLYGGSLQALIYLGRYDQAFAWALEARRIFQKRRDDLRLARLESNIGNILYRQDRFEEALESYQRALAGLSRLGEPQDVAIALRNIAVCNISLSNFERALRTYARAREHCERHGLTLLVAEADYNIAYLHYQRGDYTRAIELYRATRYHCEELGDPYHRALCDLDQSEMYLELNLDEEGAQLATGAVSSFRELGMRYEEAKAITFLALSFSHQGMVERALGLFDRARRLFLKEGNRNWVALIDLYQAIVHFENGGFDEARHLCEAAFSAFSASSLESKAALCELLLARLHLKTAEPEGALWLCRAALKRVNESETPLLACQAFFVLGQIREAQRNARAAKAAYAKAHALLESLRSHLRAEELKIAFLKDKLQVYESLVWMCLRGVPTRRKKKEAFAYIEQAKSRSLADLMIFRELDLPHDLGARNEMMSRVRTLREDLNSLYRQIELYESGPDGPKTDRLKSLRGQSRKCEDELVRALTELRSAEQRFCLLQDAGTVKLESIRSTLGKESILLEYYQARGTVYASVIGADKLEIVPLAAADRVRDLVRLLQFQLSKFRLGEEYLRHFSAALLAATDTHLRELHQELVAPVRKWLKTSHLVVVPHNFLHYLPFHALHDGQRYLTDDFSISYAPSASIYYLCTSRPSAAPNQSLILGIPDARAPHIFEEVCNVASALPNAKIFVGADATEARMRRHAPDSRFIHVASHGLFRQDNPMFSSMRLGDSQLSLLDLYSMNFSSELITLSGCGTGLNAVVGGDELLGLVRGLLYAGTRAVLVTLWDVDDKSTADFMKSFYGHLSLKADKSLALQRAMQETREHYPHPYYWAPFALIGGVDGRRSASCPPPQDGRELRPPPGSPDPARPVWAAGARQQGQLPGEKSGSRECTLDPDLTPEARRTS